MEFLADPVRSASDIPYSDYPRSGKKARASCVVRELTPDDRNYVLAAFFFANGEAALPALIAAQRFFAASAIAFRPAALSLRFAGAGAAAGEANSLLRGGLPRRLTVP
jgi:hypothetical protein